MIGLLVRTASWVAICGILAGCAYGIYLESGTSGVAGGVAGIVIGIVLAIPLCIGTNWGN